MEPRERNLPVIPLSAGHSVMFWQCDVFDYREEKDTDTLHIQVNKTRSSNGGRN